MQSESIMLSKQVTKIIQNLEKKKFREKYQIFKVEGEKLVDELLRSSFKIHSIFAYTNWIEKNQKRLHGLKVEEVDTHEMSQLSNFQSLPEVIALVHIPTSDYQKSKIQEELSIVLNGIQDPGNLGTILRVADWFGIHHVFCDSDCAGVYNSKCVQASMGAIFRVKTYYPDLPALFQEMQQPDFPIYGTFLDGQNIYTTPLHTKGFIIMGNEGKGISTTIEPFINHKLTIPSFAQNEYATESLNVGVATGIILSEFKRR